MTRPRHITIEGKQYLWRDILELRRQQRRVLFWECFWQEYGTLGHEQKARRGEGISNLMDHSLPRLQYFAVMGIP